MGPPAGISNQGFQDPATDSTSSSVLSLSYYQRFFSITTSDVLERLLLSFYPTPRFRSSIEGNPDLYGPFWTATTVAFVLYVTSGGNISQLSLAIICVYLYAFLTPLIIWMSAGYAGVKGMTVMEVITVYGYGMTMWIAVAVLCIIPIESMRWLAVLGAVCVSGAFLIRNVHALLGTAESGGATGFDLNAGSAINERANILRMLWILLGFLHFVFAIFLKVMFFSYEWNLSSVFGGSETPSDAPENQENPSDETGDGQS